MGIETLLSSGVQLLQGAGSVMTSSKNRQFADQQARKAEQHEIDMWNLQNEYNTPSAQMNRLKSAGLNPNMIYGAGSAGASGTATGRPGAHVAQGSYANPLEHLSPYIDVRLKNAQARNVDSQTTNTQMDTANKAIQNARSSLDLGVAEELRDASIHSAYLDLFQKEIQNWISNREYAIRYELGLLEKESRVSTLQLPMVEKQQAEQSISESIARIALIAEQARRAGHDADTAAIETELRQLELNLRRLGIRTNETGVLGLVQRVAGIVIQSFFPTLLQRFQR